MVRTDRGSNRTKELLSDIVMKDPRPEWVAWARQQLHEIGQPLSAPLGPEPSSIDRCQLYPTTSQDYMRGLEDVVHG